MTLDLTALGGVAANAADVQEIVTVAAGLDREVPVILLPIRLETRFVQVDVPVEGPAPTLLDLRDVLAKSGRALERVAATELQTLFADRGDKSRREFREGIKAEYGLLERWLTDARDGLEQTRTLVRDALALGDGGEQAVTDAAAALRKSLAGARASINGLRSDFQRQRFTGELDALAELADSVLETLVHETLPAARLRAALAAPTVPTVLAEREAARREAGARDALRPQTARPAQRVAPSGATPRVLRATATEAQAVTGAAVVLPHGRLAAGAAAFGEVVAGIREIGDDPSAVAALAGTASTIPLLPAAWKRDLLAAAEQLGKRSRTADTESLLEAIRAIRSDDARLDDAVANIDLTIVVAPATRVQDRLHVRIYPDDLAVDTHEEALTVAERDAGIGFWTATVAAGANEEHRRSAWRALCLGRGTRRAAWIARQLTPLAADPTPGAVAAELIVGALAALEAAVRTTETRAPDRLPVLAKAAAALLEAIGDAKALPETALEALRERFKPTESALRRVIERRPVKTLDTVSAAAIEQTAKAIDEIAARLEQLTVEQPPALKFPPAPAAPKDGAWTRAATAGVLPARFLAVAVTDDRVAHAVAGGPVNPDLKLSIDPSGGDQFELDPSGELVVGASIRWMVDLDEAHAKGMAVTLDITPEEAEKGFDRIYVIGLHEASAADGAAALEELLENHHFGHAGLEVVPIGTPTNNTEAASAGFESSDDADAGFDRERGEPLISAASPTGDQAPDGARLAGALGVDLDVFAHVGGAAGRDAAEAQVMGRALHAATVGGWLEEQAAPLVTRHGRERLKTFANGHVAARGLVPAFRVGRQPYGVLPVTAWSHFEPDPDDVLGLADPGANRPAQAEFDDILHRVLDVMLDDWKRQRALHVRIATDAAAGEDGRAHFLHVLGLEPTSVGGAYRFAVNVAGRHGPPSLDPRLRFGLPTSDPRIPSTGAEFGPYALMQRFDQILRDATGIASTAPLRDATTGQIHADLVDLWERVQGSRAYELRHLEKKHELPASLVEANPGPALQALVAATPSSLVNAAWSGTPPASSLLSLLLRHAHLVELRDAALQLLVDKGFFTEEQRVLIGSSGHFQTGGIPPSLTTWSYLLEDLTTLDGYPQPFPSEPTVVNGGPLIDRLGPTTVGDLQPYAQRVARHAADIQALSALPPDRLKVLLGEQLDLASHRLDAWITGFSQRRLTALRAARPRGAQLGAYGWVDDLRPKAGHRLAANVPAALNGDPSRPVHHDKDNQGFLHAPSLSHAVTAAILRSGYLSQHAEADVDNRMAVNLSSRRTRLALGLIDGVRAGNALGALLGYRLERFLHEFHDSGPNAPTLDALIGPLRKAYPSVVGVDGASSTTVAPRQVCDGLKIVEAVQGWIAGRPSPPAGSTVAAVLRSSKTRADYPWGLAGGAVPALTDPTVDGLILGIDHIADALDAVADLVIAEGVHQFARGNHARAVAALTALAEGKAPPRPEVVDTPRTGTPLVHRILLQLPEAAALPAAWAAIELTPRAACEPAVNAWLAGILGDPANLRLRLIDAATGADAGEVSVVDLGLHAIDLLEILGPGLETGIGEIAARAQDACRPREVTDLAPPAPLQVDLGRRASWDADVRSLVELAPLLESLGELVGRGRSATAHDYVLATPDTTGGGDGIDAVELGGRVNAARDALVEAGVALAELLSGTTGVVAADLDGDPRAYLAALPPADLPAWITRELWRLTLLDAAAFGITAALPPATFAGRVSIRQQLRSAAETAFIEVVDRLHRADEHLGEHPDAHDLQAAAAQLFGEAFPIVPVIAPTNAIEVQAALGKVASVAEIDAWLQGAGMVREGAGALCDVLALADAHDAALAAPAVAQLPHDPALPEPWLGGRTPAAASLPGRLSLVIVGPLRASGAALLVDEWTEILPSTDETTGVAVHYDQPDATPPQCVLVAVPPVRHQPWSLGNLVLTLHDTFELARVRAIELEHLGSTLYGQLLPAITGELVPDVVRHGTTTATTEPASPDRVILDFGAVQN